MLRVVTDDEGPAESLPEGPATALEQATWQRVIGAQIFASTSLRSTMRSLGRRRRWRCRT